MGEYKLSPGSLDIIEVNKLKLKNLFPPAVDDEGNVNFDILKKLLGDESDDKIERYEFSWPGKIRSLLESQKRSTGTLLPCKEESKNWDSTKNIYIEGDNLEVLKILQNSYYNKIKAIYIDPPYNTGKDFIYEDDYEDNLKNYTEFSKQVFTNEKGKTVKLSSNKETDGRFHTKWLNNIYPRIILARNLLNDEGVLFLSIDEKEMSNLKKICNEIFGENNFLGTIVVKSNPGGRDYGGIALQHDYVLCYSKSYGQDLNMIQDKEKIFGYYDDLGGFDYRELRNRNIRFHKGNRPNLCYPFFVNPNNQDENGFYEVSLEQKEGYIKVMPKKSQGVQTVWRWGKEKSLQNLNTNVKAKMKKDGTFMIIEKYRSPFKRERSIWDEKSVRNEAGSLLIKDLFGFNPFDYPKSLDTIKRIISLGNSEDAIILDFYAGSSTTAHAVMELNAEFNLNQKFIMVQLPVPPKDNSEINNKNYRSICDIGKERINLAGDKIIEKFGDETLDVGFKVFKLATSNMEHWDSSVIYDSEEKYDEALRKYIHSYKKDRTKEDILYELIIKSGFSLNSEICTYSNEKNTLYYINGEKTLICLDEKIECSIVEYIFDLLNTIEVKKIIFNDSSFKSSSEKYNIKIKLESKVNVIETF